MQRLFILLPLFFLGQLLTAQDFSTYVYFEDDTTSLSLDLFLPEKPSDSPAPLLVFVHGGGFSGGDRTGGHALGRALSKEGIACASISYTLYMEGRTQDWSCDGILPEKIKAIQLAANDLWLATDFLLHNAKKWNLDKEAIFIGGSSAGGETVLHAAYWDRQQMALKNHTLPAEFRYAGLVSGAGAIMDLNLITKENQLPSFLFHGDADPVVPYATAAHHYCPPNASGWLMLFGSGAVADHQEVLGGDFELITFAGGTHSFAGYFFGQKQEMIVEFIHRKLGNNRFQFRETRPKE
jgi:acetyl esterase/lipase